MRRPRGRTRQGSARAGGPRPRRGCRPPSRSRTWRACRARLYEQARVDAGRCSAGRGRQTELDVFAEQAVQGRLLRASTRRRCDRGRWARQQRSLRAAARSMRMRSTIGRSCRVRPRAGHGRVVGEHERPRARPTSTRPPSSGTWRPQRNRLEPLHVRAAADEDLVAQVIRCGTASSTCCRPRAANPPRAHRARMRS